MNGCRAKKRGERRKKPVSSEKDTGKIPWRYGKKYMKWNRWANLSRFKKRPELHFGGVQVGATKET